MNRILTSIVITLVALPSFSAFSNPNSVLIGEQAAGMGGAYTALSGDSSASGFYNPASLVLIEGNSVSASATLYNKFDTAYGEGGNLFEAGERVNRGFFRTIPSSIGNVYKPKSMKNWAFGFNIIVPDYDFFSGNIANTAQAESFLSYTEESLWSGAVASYKIDDHQSIGMSLYYTARSLIRSSQDRTIVSSTQEIITNEDKSITHNSIVAIIGYQWLIDKKWSLGVSARPQALNISGEGSYYLTTTDTSNLPSQTVQYPSTGAKTFIPPRYALGLGLKSSESFTMSFDVSYMTGFGYEDMDNSNASDRIEHEETFNFAFGGEYKFRDPNFDFRFGFFTNNSTHPEIAASPTRRVADHLDMLGFSANIAFMVSENSQYTVGGFYFGGNGHSVQRTENQWKRLDKEHHVFSLLISTAYRF